MDTNVQDWNPVGPRDKGGWKHNLLIHFDSPLTSPLVYGREDRF